MERQQRPRSVGMISSGDDPGKWCFRIPNLAVPFGLADEIKVVPDHHQEWVQEIMDTKFAIRILKMSTVVTAGVVAGAVGYAWALEHIRLILVP